MEQAQPREIEPEVEGEEDAEHPVTTLELFFDLVFVFALTQVTGFMSDNPTWSGVAKGMLILSALWFAWGAYAWLTNEIDPNEGSARLAVFGAMAAMFVAALAVPHAFDSDAVLFGLAYFAVRLMHIVLFAEATPHVDVRQATFRLARTAIPGPALLVVAGFLDGSAQIALWVVALVIDYGGPYVFGVRGFSVSADHFAERYGLIVIIALGESIVAIGIGAAGIELGPAVVIAAILGLALACALWWAYFDVVALGAPETAGGAGPRPRALRPRRVQLSPPADVRGHRPHRPRGEEGNRARGRAARVRARGRPLRRRRPLPAEP
jgi:low temperature requirement protein LtrA